MSTDPIQRLPVDFGRLLKQRRVERGWDPARFVASAGLAGEETLGRLESGEVEPSLTEFFHVSLFSTRNQRIVCRASDDTG